VSALARTLRTVYPIVISAGLAVALASCATMVARDDLPRDAAKGWVVFVSDDRLPLSISQIPGSSAGGRFDNRTPRGTPVAVACAPGRNEFALRDGDREARVAVPVVERMVTYVGVRMQVSSEQPTVAYATRVTVGTHPLPFRPDARDPAPLVTALVDRDWATRWAAARALERISPPIEPSASPLLATLAREDPSAEVRAAARSALKSAGKSLPAESLVFLSFEQSADGWPLGEGLSSITSLAPEGYLLQVRDPGGTAWRTRGAGDAVSGRTDFDVLLECRWVSGDGASAYGLTLGSGPATFNAFCVSRDGGAAVSRFTDGRHRADPLPRRYAAAPAITGTPVTRIEVTRRGARYELAVNGAAVGGFTDDTGLAVDRLGVFVDGEQSVVFRKIIVTAP